MARRKRKRRIRKNRCRFCRDKIVAVDYKNLENLQRLMSSEAAVYGKKLSGNCSRHQRIVKRAVKSASFLSLLPYL